MHWISEAYRRWLDFSGRSRRMEYWSFALFLFVVQIVLVVVLQAAGLIPKDGVAARAGTPSILVELVVLGALLVIVLIPGLAVTVRRLHDTGRTGWWAVLPIAPMIWASVETPGKSGLASLLLFSGVVLATWLVLLALLLIEGTRGPNRFGPDPKAAIAA